MSGKDYDITKVADLIRSDDKINWRGAIIILTNFVEKQGEENDNQQHRIAVLERALELACEGIDECPHGDGEGMCQIEDCAISKDPVQCWSNIYIMQAKSLVAKNATTEKERDSNE